MYISAKNAVRLFSFACAGILALTGIIVKEYIDIADYRRRQEYGYIRSLQELTSYVNTVAVDLQKAAYAGTPAQLSAISAKLWRDTGAAKAAMGSLPTGGTSLDSTYRFLSQAGDYAMYLSRKSVNGQEPTEQERQDFAKLADYAASLGSRLGEVEKILGTGGMGVEDYFLMQANEAGSPLMLENLAGLRDMEDCFDGYPTLIYDGPFSDGLSRQEPELIKNEAEVSPGEALAQAAKYAGIDPALFHAGEEEASRMPSYTFRSGAVDVGVTKNGGHVTYLINSREIGEKSVSAATAREKARSYLAEMGLDSMSETGYETANGICTFNFAYKRDGVIFYADSIKVGIALDKGDVVSYDARGFIGSHRERELPGVVLSAGKARESLNSSLSVKRTRLAFVPVQGGREALAYEFLCAGNGHDVLVYINAENGVEEQILILIESGNGTLTV